MDANLPRFSVCVTGTVSNGVPPELNFEATQDGVLVQSLH